MKKTMHVIVKIVIAHVFQAPADDGELNNLEQRKWHNEWAAPLMLFHKKISKSDCVKLLKNIKMKLTNILLLVCNICYQHYLMERSSQI